MDYESRFADAAMTGVCLLVAAFGVSVGIMYCLH